MNLVRLRGAAEVTQEELGFTAGLPTSTVSKIERGVLNPTVRTLERVAGGLGVGVAELFREAE